MSALESRNRDLCDEIRRFLVADGMFRHYKDATPETLAKLETARQIIVENLRCLVVGNALADVPLRSTPRGGS
jgi:hypothetical protein